MNLFISDAFAQSGNTAQSPVLTFIMFGAIFVLFYFMLIRPQQKKQKEHREMVANLKKGDEVVTVGGVLGKISNLDENFVSLEIADGVEIKVQRHAVQLPMQKGTIKGTMKKGS